LSRQNARQVDADLPGVSLAISFAGYETYSCSPASLPGPAACPRPLALNNEIAKWRRSALCSRPLAQVDEHIARRSAVHVGRPAFTHIAGRATAEPGPS
jgi:hypothetical protein